jgi:hypothetical protein
MKTCIIDECDKTHFVPGCHMRYTRWRRHGNLTTSNYELVNPMRNGSYLPAVCPYRLSL